MKYNLTKKKNNEYMVLDFDDWNYQQDDSCSVKAFSLKECDLRRFILENIEIEISRNGPHSRIEIKGDYITGFSDELEGTSFHFYKALENHNLEQAKEFIIEWFNDFNKNLFDSWEDKL